MIQEETLLTPNPLIKESLSVDALSQNQQRFLVAKLHGMTDSDAARAIGLTPSSTYAWKKDPEYKKVYDGIVNDPLQFASEQITFATAKAVDRLISLLDHKSVAVVRYAIDKLVDLGGLSKPHRMEVLHTDATNREELDELTEAWRQHKLERQRENDDSTDGDGAREVQNQHKLLH